MESRKVIVVQDDCPFCNFIKSELEAKGVNVEIVNSSTPEGKVFVDRHNVKRLPQCVVVSKGEEAETARTCTSAEFDALWEDKKK